MPKLKIEGTQTAVKRPSSRCPENQRKADTANEIVTANRMKKSDFLIIVLAFICPNNLWLLEDTRKWRSRQLFGFQTAHLR